MTKTVKIFRNGAPTEDHVWALAMTDSERIDLATRLTRDLWCAAHGGAYPTMDRTKVRIVK